MLPDGALEAELVLKSFTIENTRAGGSKFREIIPAARHDRNQFMLLYTASGGTSGSSMAIVTVDSPKVIFAMDPLFALLDFFTSTPDEKGASTIAIADNAVEAPPRVDSYAGFNLRLDLHDVSVSVLESDSDPATQAIQLTIRQLLMSQQVGDTLVI
jgi:vacuolar protein sorting-associated protein 13A/C